MTIAYRAFSSPGEADTKFAIASVLAMRHRRTLAQLYQLNASEKRYSLAWNFIEANLERLTQSEDLVQPGIGRLAQAGLNGEHGLLQFALLVAAFGGQGGYQMELTLDHTAYFDCHLIDLQSFVLLEASAGRVQIRTRKGGMHTTYWFELRNGAWADCGAPDGSTCDLGARSINVFNVENAGILDERITAIFPFSSSGLPDICRDTRTAFNIIGSSAPEYMEWIGHVLRAIVFLGPQDGSTVSHSSELRPGMIAISHPVNIPHLSAQLVHECSHQYFFLLQHEVFLTDYTSERLYVSPLREEPRPLVLALLALHASVNIKRFIERAVAGGVRSGFFDSELEELDVGIRRSIDDLVGSEDFTEAGKAFFECIAQA
jgi:hypothetical protein